MLRRSPFTLLGALLVVLLLWWSQSQSQDEPAPPPAPSSGAEPSVDSIGPAQTSPQRDQDSPDPALATVRLADLPAEAQEVVAAIDAGGPFAHPDSDGSRFGNYEGVLPQRPRGHYRKYTVPTPGLDHRGARRIVVGADGVMYWTDDHYASFARIRR